MCFNEKFKKSFYFYIVYMAFSASTLLLERYERQDGIYKGAQWALPGVLPDGASLYVNRPIMVTKLVSVIKLKL